MSKKKSGVAMGFTYFAATMMIMIGIFDVVQGFSAILRQHIYTVNPDYAFKFNVPTWGWSNLILGAIMFLAGFGLLRAAAWARTVGVIVAVLVAVANFMWLPYYPVWATLIIALCVTVIWALTAHGHDMAED